MTNKQQLKNMGGVVALLAGTLAFSPSAFALNTILGNSTFSNPAQGILVKAL